jgi:hypothetical protein
VSSLPYHEVSFEILPAPAMHILGCVCQIKLELSYRGKVSNNYVDVERHESLEWNAVNCIHMFSLFMELTIYA